jgi:serine/threonine protein kinase
VRHLREATIGEYEILTELGRGGMAAVFLAHEHALNRKVALKVMSPALMMGSGMIERFYSEAVTQANLAHPNIVGVHAVRDEGDLHFFVMQFVPGRTLQQVLRAELTAGRWLSFDVVRALLYQTGVAVAYAHRRGVIHRDIKPGNVILNADGNAVVTDFGIAKVTEAPSQTMTGSVVGTPAYMSPEQCFASELTPASDQYSLGILAYELICGRTPFQGASFALMQAHTMQAPAPLSELRADCPPELEAAVLRMLAKRPGDRFSDIDEALHALGAEPPSMTAGPLRQELQRLADVSGVQEKLADVIRGPMSPSPRTRSGSSRRLEREPSGQPAAPAAASREPSAIVQSSDPGLAAAPVSMDDATRSPATGVPAPTSGIARRRNLVLGAGAVALVALFAYSRTPLAPGTGSVQPATSAPETLAVAAPPAEPARDTASSSTAALDVAPPPPVTSPARPAVGRPTPPTRERSPSAPAVTEAPAGAAARPVDPPGRPSPEIVAVQPAANDSAAPRRETRPLSTRVDSSPPVTAPRKTEAELTAEAEQSLRAVVVAIGTKDTAQLRRVFPSAPATWLNQWQSLFESAGEVESSLLGVNALGSPSAAEGSTTRFRVRHRLRLRGGRIGGSRSFESAFTAVLRRDGDRWTVSAIDQQ